MTQNLDYIIEHYGITAYFEEINKFKPYMKIVTMPKGSFIFNSSDQTKYVYFLLSGRLQIHATSEDGRQMLVWYDDSFVFLGDMELFGFSDPSNLIECVSACTLLRMDITSIRAELLDDRQFLRYLCRGMAAKIQILAKEQFRNQANTPQEKVAMYLLDKADETGYFRENLRRVSEILAISYRHLHRVLSELVDAGILERKTPGYQILSRNRLEEIILNY